MPNGSSYLGQLYIAEILRPELSAKSIITKYTREAQRVEEEEEEETALNATEWNNRPTLSPKHATKQADIVRPHS